MKLAIIGASGLVGRTMVKVLEERNFPLDELRLFSSSRSAGQVIKFRQSELVINQLTEESFRGIDIALFSAGQKCSKEFAPIAAQSGCIVVDNSSYWRMNPNVPLCVPEVNPESIEGHKGIIANPNCSTIQLVVVLNVLHKLFQLKRVIVSTYQSISGAGQKGIDKLMGELNDENLSPRDHPIAFNTMFHSFQTGDDFTDEEVKMIEEPKKIMSLPHLKIAVTCVRLPFLAGHGESVNIETEKEIDFDLLRTTLDNEDGIILMDDPANNLYPTPLICKDTDPVYVGRIRKDNTVENGAYLWIVADNLRKGAATNAVQIAELLK